VGQTPAVAIVGRPNVGKSTLFNRLVGRRQSIVHDQPGITRDRIVGKARLDDDRPIHLIDTGGLLLEDDALGLNDQVDLAIEESDLLLLVVDGKAGRTPADEEICQRLRKRGKPTVLVVNKGDAATAKRNFNDFFALGVDPQVLVSAEHGLGLQELHDRMAERLPRLEAPVEEGETARLAIVGRPNVGKSSLLNRIVGAERALVSEQAGTTRDPIDTVVTVGQNTFRLVDTAGIRRRSRTSGAPEELAIMMAQRQLERADLAILVIEAGAGVTTGDLSIAGVAWELGRAVVVAVNKWDLLDDEGRKILEESWPRLERLTSGAERVNVSARTGRALERLFPAVERTLDQYRCQLSTAHLNGLIEAAVRRHHAPTEQGRPWKIYYGTQLSTGPPTFVLFANRSLPRQAPYRRYLKNFLRREMGLRGVPVRLQIRSRSSRR
jgi:GTP-binding protein